MEVIKVQKGRQIAKRKDKVKEWYLIQEGSVTQRLGFAEITLGKNSIIGLLEQDWFICDYAAQEDCVLVVIPCAGADDLKGMLAANERYRVVFLRTAKEQTHVPYNNQLHYLL